MPDIDPITREALKRASQMHGHISRNSQSPPKPPQRNSTRAQSPHKTAPVPEPQNSPPEQKPDTSADSQPKNSLLNDPLKALFKDKEESIILILVLLLMDEKADSSLLLALIYLLI